MWQMDHNHFGCTALARAFFKQAKAKTKPTMPNRTVTGWKPPPVAKSSIVRIKFEPFHKNG
jgi:hypothetical protein